MPIGIEAEIWQIAVVLLLCALLALFVLVNELRRPSNKRLGLRLGLNLIAILALALLGLQPTRIVPVIPKKIALLTDSTHFPQLDSLIRTGSFEVFSFKPIPKTIHIQDAGIIARNFVTSEIHVFGHGLDKADLARLHGQKIIFHPSELPEGIVELQTTQSITLGDVLHVKGLVRGTFKRLEFRANEVCLDSLFNLQEETPFEFSFTPKQTGKINLSLVLDDREEKWGVYVLPPQPLSILVLQSKPTFEIKYLKNFLTQRGYRFAIRIVVGKERYREEFWKMQSQSMARLSQKMLAQFDLMIVDEETIQALTPLERKILQNAVLQDGLGIFINELDSLWYQRAADDFFQPFEFQAYQAREQPVSWKTVKLPPISIEAMVIKSNVGVQSLLEDADGQSVAAFCQKGLGRIAVSLVQRSYQWQLEGKSNVYATYWSHVLSAIAKHSSRTLINVPPVSIVHQPIEFTVQTTLATPRMTIQEDLQETVIPLRQETLNPTTWQGRYWASKSGWISFKVDGKEYLWAFVSDETMFEALRKEARRKETIKAIQFNQHQDEKHSNELLKQEPDKVLICICLCSIVLAMGGLWVERKI